jgi:hypothetical protein
MMKIRCAFTALSISLATAPLLAQPGPAGRGGRGPDRTAQSADMELFHYLLDHRKSVERSVKELSDGVETETMSQDADVAEKIREHAESMHERLKVKRPIHARDPLFAEIFRHADKIRMDIEPIDGGVRVKETSADPYVAKLLQAHAEVVTLFLKNGHEEVRKNHAVPARD